MKIILCLLVLLTPGCAALDRGVDFLAEIDPQNVIASKVAPAVIAGVSSSIEEHYGDTWGNVAMVAGAAATAILGSYAGTRRRKKKA